MDFVYYRIKDIKYKGYNIYYKKPINILVHQAKEFNDKYIYYYKSLWADSKMELLGTFKGYGKRSSTNRNEDYDYDVLEFDNDCVSWATERIYCTGISEKDRKNMIEVEDMLYQEFSVYYEEF
jgi:hypothetical protein